MNNIRASRPLRRYGALAAVIAALFILSSLMVSLFARRSQDKAWQRIQSSGAINFAVDASYPPFEALDVDGNFFGFDIDLAREIARRLGVRALFENIAYDGLLGALVSDRDDAAISALVTIPERLNEVAYTRPYFNGGPVVVVSRGAEPDYHLTRQPVTAWAQGRAIAVEYGSNADALLRQWAKRVPGLTRGSYPSADEAMLAVENHAADAALVDGVSAYGFLAGHPALAIAGPPVEDELYVVAVARQSPILLRELNRALAQIEADGTLAKLRVQWFGEAARAMNNEQ